MGRGKLGMRAWKDSRRQTLRWSNTNEWLAGITIGQWALTIVHIVFAEALFGMHRPSRLNLCALPPLVEAGNTGDAKNTRRKEGEAERWVASLSHVNMRDFPCTRRTL